MTTESSHDAVDDSQLDDAQADDPQLDDPKLDDPRLDEPKLDDPKLDDPKLDDQKLDDPKLDDRVADAQEAIQEARQRLAEVPAEIVVANHVMGLYELAAIHLSSATPDLRAAALAIDAVACLVDGLGDRIGENAPTMRDALANIRMAFVQIKAAHAASPAPDTPGDTATHPE